MKKGIIGILFCVLLVASSLIPASSAETKPSEKASDSPPVQPLGFAKFDVQGGLGIRIWGWCLDENYNSMTLTWQKISGGKPQVGLIVSKPKFDGDQVFFFRWYLVRSFYSQFALYLSYNDGGVPHTKEVFTAKVRGLYVYDVKYV